MSADPGGTGSGGSPLRRAHRSLWILIAVTILASGAVMTTATAPPGPLTGVAFGLSSAVLAIGLSLAARITVALEAARRAGRPPIRLADSFPALGRLVQRRGRG